jgi:hypothetical protein
MTVAHSITSSARASSVGAGVVFIGSLDAIFGYPREFNDTPIE